MKILFIKTKTANLLVTVTIVSSMDTALSWAIARGDSDKIIMPPDKMPQYSLTTYFTV